MRVMKRRTTATPSAREVAATARQESGTSVPSSDAKQLRTLREEAETLAREGGQPPPPVRRPPPTDMPSTESVLKKVEAQITGARNQTREEPRISARDAAREARAPAKTTKPAQTVKPAQAGGGVIRKRKTLRSFVCLVALRTRPEEK